MLDQVPFWGIALNALKRCCGPAAVAIAALWASPSSGCGYLYFGSPETIIGRTVAITYDRILDSGCGGPWDPPGGIVIAKPQQGSVQIQNGRFRYVANKNARGTDRFVMSGLYKDRPYKMVVNVTFK